MLSLSTGILLAVFFFLMVFGAVILGFSPLMGIACSSTQASIVGDPSPVPHIYTSKYLVGEWLQKRLEQLILLQYWGKGDRQTDTFGLSRQATANYNPCNRRTDR